MSDTVLGGGTIGEDHDYVYVECSCHHPEHTIRFSRWDEDADGYAVDVQYFLVDQRFWPRLRDGIKYIFGFKTVYGHFGEVLMAQETAKKLGEWLLLPTTEGAE